MNYLEIRPANKSCVKSSNAAVPVLLRFLRIVSRMGCVAGWLISLTALTQNKRAELGQFGLLGLLFLLAPGDGSQGALM